MSEKFLPVTRQEMEERGIFQPDMFPDGRYDCGTDNKRIGSAKESRQDVNYISFSSFLTTLYTTLS